jgi:hypothetical protein
MRVKRLDSSITETMLINGKTFRFIRMEDATGYVVISADEWTGWQWKRRRQWIGDSMGMAGRFSRGAKAGRARARASK